MAGSAVALRPAATRPRCATTSPVAAWAVVGVVVHDTTCTPSNKIDTHLPRKISLAHAYIVG